jgi:16S rRNA (guanine527-N7)-methyltransferase
VESSRISRLLQPFLKAAPGAEQLNYISIYIDVLLRWNARINLTAVRDPEQIVTRHFGESLFAAEQLFPDGVSSGPSRVLDVGSGAGFPGLPIKLWIPSLQVTLIESRQKKVAFLREVIRQLTLTGIDVFAGRAEDHSGSPGDVVTLRAIEHFESAAPIAASRVAPGGRLALLIGKSQREVSEKLLSDFAWQEPEEIPQSGQRILLIGRRILGRQESQ